MRRSLFALAAVAVLLSIGCSRPDDEVSTAPSTRPPSTTEPTDSTDSTVPAGKKDKCAIVQAYQFAMINTNKALEGKDQATIVKSLQNLDETGKALGTQNPTVIASIKVLNTDFNRRTYELVDPKLAAETAAKADPPLPDAEAVKKANAEINLIRYGNCNQGKGGTTTSSAPA